MYLALLCVCILVMSGCHYPTGQKVVAKVNNYTITQTEFNEEYHKSAHVTSTLTKSRQDVLNNMIDQKLILLDAQKRGLDKNAEFLKMVENFWQQSLLTLALKEKSNEGVDLDQWVNNLRRNNKIVIYEENIK